MTTNNAWNSPTLTSTGNGTLLIGQTTGNAAAATLTASTGITITNGTNSITIASNGASNVVDQNTGSVTMAINTVYITDNGASLVTYTLPATAPLGSFFEIMGASSGGWTIAEASGQTIHFGNVAATTTSGSLSSTNQYDCVKLRCTTANTTFVVQNAQGNITVA